MHAFCFVYYSGQRVQLCDIHFFINAKMLGLAKQKLKNKLHLFGYLLTYIYTALDKLPNSNLTLSENSDRLLLMGHPWVLPSGVPTLDPSSVIC